MMSAEYTDISMEEITSFSQVIENIEAIKLDLDHTIEEVNAHLRELIKCGYYNRVSITFRCRIYEAILFFQATIKDLEGFDNQEYIKEDQVELLRNMAKTASNLNTSLRFTWKTDSYPEDYSQERFLVLAQVYRECARMFVALENIDSYIEFLEKNE